MRVCALITCVVVAGCVANAAPVTIVQDGQPTAAIVIPEDAPAEITRAADEMLSCIEEASGARLQTGTEPAEGLAAIHVGETAYVQSLEIEMDTDSVDAYTIRFPAPDTVVILGASPSGTEFGVYGFLERFLDVRWLLPGESGRDVPEQATIVIEDEPVRDEPVFMSRLFSGGRGAHNRWARKNGMHGTIQFHHNLRELYKPEVFGEEHPEFYPLWDGERFNPLESDTRWQPCFTAPGIVQAGIDRIVQYFNEHPQATSYSLGVNDTRRHCECESCRALDPGRENFLGLPHLSDRYFTWANAVVEGVLEVHPDKYFGCLAYNCVVEPPDRVEVHPRIIPYMTYDRMKWIHPEIEAQGKALTEAWAEASPTLGWYDYIYGTPYCLPRYYPHTMSEYLRWGYEHGVRALYAEAYPNFGEGPKLYVWLALGWDPYTDVDALLDEWFERCCGPDSADALRSYYEFWETFWTERILESEWFSEGGQYLRFNTPTYLSEVTPEEIAQCRAWLEEAVANAHTDKQRARGELLLRAFEYYEASALAYPRAEAVQESPATEQEALARLEDGLQSVAMAEKRLELAQQFEDHPVLVHPLPPQRYSATRGTGWGTDRIWQLYEWAQQSETVRRKLQDLAANSEHDVVRENASLMLSVVEGEAENLATNPSFEEGDQWATGWTQWVKFGVGSKYRTTEMAHSGEASVCCEGMRRGGPHQSHVLEPGKYAATCFCFVPEGQETTGTGTVALTPIDPDGNNIAVGELSATVIPSGGRWQTLAVAGEIPSQIGGTSVDQVRLIVIVDGFDPDGKVYLDDVNLFRVE
ncbi:MAG: DUF4838 domain-containing protein [Armatimonadota bacterium]|nr:DUF4838 domain-containing protein [Armatimonadota bacterium]